MAYDSSDAFDFQALMVAAANELQRASSVNAVSARRKVIQAEIKEADIRLTELEKIRDNSNAWLSRVQEQCYKISLLQRVLADLLEQETAYLIH